MYHPILITFLLKLIFFRTKFFWNLRGTFESSKHSLFGKLFIKISIFFSSFVPHKIICCSNQVRKNFREIGYPDNKLVTINNGYDFKYLNFDYTLKEKIRKKYKLNGETILFGMASRFNEQKDYSNLLRALELLTKQKSKNIKFLFAGMGNVDSNKNLVNLIKKFNLENNIILLGYMNIKDFFHLIDVHVLSSSHGEGFPNVVAESMLCNVFSIATDVGESKNIIESFGCVVKPEDPSALCDAMLKSFNLFVDNKKDFLEMTKKGRVHVVNNYSINLMLKNYHDVWNN